MTSSIESAIPTSNAGEGVGNITNHKSDAKAGGQDDGINCTTGPRGSRTVFPAVATAVAAGGSDMDSGDIDVGSENSFYSNDGNSSILSRVTSFSQSTVNTITTTTATTTSSSPYPYWQEPIKVGYAFGAKKMTTMGVVMAEASRVQVIHEEPGEEEEQDEEGIKMEDTTHTTPSEHEKDLLLTSFGDVTENKDSDDGGRAKRVTVNNNPSTIPTNRNVKSFEDGKKDSCHSRTPTTGEQHKKLTSDALRDLAESTESVDGRNSTIISLKNTDETDIQHIVRYFRSNCSSAAGSLAGSMSETTTSTPTTAYGNGTSSCNVNVSPNGTMCHHTQQKRGRQRRKRSRYPVHISFVPLDCDQPLEDQHGGNFDLILHKLTEDILSCSLTTERDDLSGRSRNGSNSDLTVHYNNDASRKRVQALHDYHRDHDYCCLVDDPTNVQTVMSRSDIAHVLRECLRGVYSSSGIPVRSPRFVVIGNDSEESVMDSHVRCESNFLDGSISHSQAERLREQLLEEEIFTPIIVKPLIAAGTKQSHSMLIALRDSAIYKLPRKSIAQEYVNHNATLYKVYVLGDFVSVFDRPSLPNLTDDASSTATVDLVKFDSQRPYPKMKDFGLVGKTKKHTTSPCVKVTADEVRPIVDVLKRAFGLEMFGFDVLRGEDGGYLVVDVNYFPSYKEVEDFPFLLAQYLTQRVLEQRRNRREAEMTSNKLEQAPPPLANSI
jgi:Inositol 1,3,4-trisphosphate 5/6-kinase ATP-grasp domain/Inositol 1,3,4-trisphosphate 5/6-kinase pre-ATP-grasp domain